MEIVEWLRSVPAWILSVVEPIFLYFGIDAWISLQQFLFVIAVVIFFLVIVIINYVDAHRD